MSPRSGTGGTRAAWTTSRRGLRLWKRASERTDGSRSESRSRGAGWGTGVAGGARGPRRRAGAGGADMRHHVVRADAGRRARARKREWSATAGRRTRHRRRKTRRERHGGRDKERTDHRHRHGDDRSRTAGPGHRNVRRGSGPERAGQAHGPAGHAGAADHSHRGRRDGNAPHHGGIRGGRRSERRDEAGRENGLRGAQRGVRPGTQWAWGTRLVGAGRWVYTAGMAATVANVVFMERGWSQGPCIAAGIATVGATAMATGQVVRLIAH